MENFPNNAKNIKQKDGGIFNGISRKVIDICRSRLIASKSYHFN